jgi:hypothetical protein
MEKLELTIMHIIKLVDYKILEKLSKSDDIKNFTALNTIIEKEIKIRKTGLTGKFSEKIGSHFIQDKIISNNNFWNATAITLNITSDLSIISGYFNILKSRFDLLLLHIQTMHPSIWQKIYDKIIISGEYINIMDDEINIDSLVQTAKEKYAQNAPNINTAVVPETESTEQPT